MNERIRSTDALIVVDVQKDFLPGGALGVPGGDEVIPVINRLLPCFGLRVFTRDWHPPDHVSFSGNPTYRDGSWPPHCVQDTPGAAFPAALSLGPGDLVISKGDRRDQEAYSGFQGTALDSWLKAKGVGRVFIAGLATDYCVKNTALDAISLGFETVVVEDGVRAVNVPADSGARALEAMRAAGVRMAASGDVSCP